MSTRTGPTAGSSGEGPAPAVSPWQRLKPWLRGEPLHVPSHAMVVHLPAALLPLSLILDLAGRTDAALVLGSAASIVLVLGLAGALVAAGTGLLDWLEMVAGARRSRVTRHLVVQLAGVAAFAVSLALRWPAFGDAAPPASLALSILGTGLLTVGDHLGGLLVYRDGMRVRSGRPG